MTTVLLGAGASRDAGLPTSIEMTERLLDDLEAPSQQLLQFVYGGLLMKEATRHASHHYANQRVRVDAEELFNTVEALGNRPSLEASPFVASWHPMVEQVERNSRDPWRQEQSLEQLFKEAIAPRASAFAWKNVAKEIIKLAESSQQSQAFSSLSQDMIGKLEGLLTLKDPSSADYLAPILDLHRSQANLLVATLNYDTLVEDLAERNGVACDDGIGEWKTRGVSFTDSSIRIVKLHGSISWVEDQDGEVVRKTSNPKIGYPPRPGVIFGGRNKLRAEGPYLELLWEWRTHLSVCDRLVVIGYSFRDAHINAVIKSWVRKFPVRKLVIVDPGFNHWLNDLTRLLHDRSDENPSLLHNLRMLGLDPAPADAPVKIVRSVASAALPTVFL